MLKVHLLDCMCRAAQSGACRSRWRVCRTAASRASAPARAPLQPSRQTGSSTCGAASWQRTMPGARCDLRQTVSNHSLLPSQASRHLAYLPGVLAAGCGNNIPHPFHVFCLIVRRALVQQTTGFAPTEQQAQKWMWEGMGSDEGPVLIPGLGRVAAVQLGSAHALALVH